MTYRLVVACVACAVPLFASMRQSSAEPDPFGIYTAEVSPQTGAVVSAPKRLATGSANSWMPEFSKDGKRLAYLSSVGGVSAAVVARRPIPVMSIRSLDTGQTISFPLKFNQVFGYDWSPDGRQFAVRGTDLRDGYGIHLVDAVTGDITPLAIGTPDAVRYLGPHWAADSRRLYYLKGEPGVLGHPLMERNLETGLETLFLDFSSARTTDGQPLTHRGALVSPDRKNVAALGPPASGWKAGAAFDNPLALWVVSVETKTATRLKFEGFPYPQAGGAFAWTADSRALLVISGESSEPKARRNLWFVPVDGSPAVKLTIEIPIQNFSAAIHPDGRRIAFVGGTSSK